MNNNLQQPKTYLFMSSNIACETRGQKNSEANTSGAGGQGECTSLYGRALVAKKIDTTATGILQ